MASTRLDHLVAGRTRFGDTVLLVFAVAQVCDGVFTYVGVRTFGESIEANPVVAWYIAGLGAGTALIAAKGLAFSCAHRIAFEVPFADTLGAVPG